MHRSHAYLTPLIKTIVVEQSIIGKLYRGISNQDKEPSLIRIVELSQATVDIQTWGKTINSVALDQTHNYPSNRFPIFGHFTGLVKVSSTSFVAEHKVGSSQIFKKAPTSLSTQTR